MISKAYSISFITSSHCYCCYLLLMLMILHTLTGLLMHCVSISSIQSVRQSMSWLCLLMCCYV